MAETESEKASLIDELDSARRRTLDILKDADENHIVHPATGWRVKDVVAHILIWEEEALAALRARQKGETYTIAGFDSFERYNERAFERWRDTPFEQIKTGLHDVREEMKVVLLALPPDRFAGSMVYPWPWMGSLSDLMAIMAAHECSHADEIRQEGQSLQNQD
jgi:hypothetical protein